VDAPGLPLPALAHPPQPPGRKRGGHGQEREPQELVGLQPRPPPRRPLIRPPPLPRVGWPVVAPAPPRPGPRARAGGPGPLPRRGPRGPGGELGVSLRDLLEALLVPRGQVRVELRAGCVRGVTGRWRPRNNVMYVTKRPLKASNLGSILRPRSAFASGSEPSSLPQETWCAGRVDVSFLTLLESLWNASRMSLALAPLGTPSTSQGHRCCARDAIALPVHRSWLVRCEVTASEGASPPVPGRGAPLWPPLTACRPLVGGRREAEDPPPAHVPAPRQTRRPGYPLGPSGQPLPEHGSPPHASPPAPAATPHTRGHGSSSRTGYLTAAHGRPSPRNQHVPTAPCST